MPRALCEAAGLMVKTLLLGFPDNVVEHGEQGQQLREYGLNKSVFIEESDHEQSV